MHEMIHHSRTDGSAYPVGDCPIFNTSRNGQHCTSDNEILWRKDRTFFPVRYSSYPILDEGVIKGAVVSFRDITERKKSEEEKEKLLHDLSERIKELTVLYDFSKLNEQPDISDERYFQELVHILQLGWQYPEIACARIIISPISNVLI